MVSAPSRRAVILVGNPAAPYSRALRIGRALAAEGYAVEIAAVAAAGLPAEERDGALVIRRYAPGGRWAVAGGAPAGASTRRRSGLAGRLLRGTAAVRRWLLWPHTVRGWWSTLARDLPPADLYHACGSLTIAAALAARHRQPTGPAGQPVRVIYDAIDDVFESNNVLDMPPPIRAWHRRRETTWARAADAVTSVNEPLAVRLAARWRVGSIVVVPNYPEVPLGNAPSSPPNLIRAEIGIPPTESVVLFQGRLGPNLGLDAAADAVLLVPDAVLVLLGFGRGFEAEQARDREARYAGRHWTLPARHPDQLLAWTASADVAVVPLPPVSVNQRLSSPNKFWEALAAGTPVVVPAGLELMAALVRDIDLGVVAATESAADLAEAIRAVLARPPDERRAWRSRIAATAAERFTWPIAEAVYRQLVGSLQPAGIGANDGERR